MSKGMAMPEPVLRAFLAALPLATKAQRARVEAAMLASGRPEAEETGNASALVHEAIKAELTARGLACHTFRAWVGRPGYPEAARRVVALVHTNFAIRNRGEELVWLRRIVTVLLDARKYRGEKVDQLKLADDLPYATERIDAAFPGYRESKLLSFALGKP